ncbi:Probable leucine-rich repeat receptor-like serine/threonine-protein kinase [Striga hermonthica]|uniref:non-specific serine/threonine protein kinase n=1 Tax=Striga hermonthica TaxID=68872 RepID=A0A9N7MLX3_STRHE|nr:Probable leucine-rich repeat receptor-like serine/threonine-protein kinase [Striga hermonthica]
MLLLSRLNVAIFICFVGFVSGQPILPPDEVESLRVVANVMGKSDWNFSVDPCSGLSGWVTQNPVKGFENALTCDCTFENNTVCHVVSIILKAQNLNGSVPRELTTLPFLREIDLTRNFLNGTIPPEWGSMNLVNISLIGNRVTGSIPIELANISTLANLTLEYNQLSGTIPPALGHLPRIERLLFTSNNLTGELPESLARLSTLKDFRISDNNFSGSIPSFIQNWTNIEKLVAQGSGLAGPIPAGIASLTRLTDLRISDLTGNISTFPPLSNITRLRTLILRSCNIVGELPSYLGEMTGLKVLDLSFNRLSGRIPDSFTGLSNTDYIYIAGNSLTGTLPAWMLTDGDNIDLSYNNLSSGSSAPNCQPRNLCDYSLLSSITYKSQSVVYLPKCFFFPFFFPEYYSLYINCGGRRVVDNRNTIHEEDSNSGGPSNFFLSRTNWGFSSTGHFLDDDRPRDSFIWSNSSVMTGENPELYMDARLSPLSLTYYGFCLRNGNYTVTLHFAEIIFTNDRTYGSLGRRLFDVYIQGRLVLKDFDIEREAGGVNRPIARNFTAVVNDTTLDIRFYWAGKGTNGIPVRGVYGPLISAISVNPNYKPPLENGSSSISGGSIAGIVLGLTFAILLVLVILWWKGCLRFEGTIHQDLKGLEGSFSLRQIKAATNNFDLANKIGEGGFGPVYKGKLSDGTIIAVKQLSSKSKQGNREFVNEIGMITALHHPHLVKLYGCCIEGNQLLLVYEYMENNSLARALFSQEEHQLHLDWPTRHKICIGIARGLAYLHEESRLKIVHRDIKATNVLLDKNLVPKISDFGLAKLDEEDNTHISTRIAGTFGYMAPEYAMRGHLTDKADVYSFGVVLLEVVSGSSNTNNKYKADTFYLLDWANKLKEQGNLIQLVDSRLESNFNEQEAMTVIHLALLCTHAEAAERPNMSSVVSILEGKTVNQEPFSTPIVTTDETEKNREEIETRNVSIDVPWTGSSASTAADLYPITVDTDYWEKRDQQCSSGTAEEEKEEKITLLLNV